VVVVSRRRYLIGLAVYCTIGFAGGAFLTAVAWLLLVTQ
jgi:hypothetical protein